MRFPSLIVPLLLSTVLAISASSMPAAAFDSGAATRRRAQGGWRSMVTVTPGDYPHTPKDILAVTADAKAGDLSLERVVLPIPALDFTGFLSGLSDSLKDVRLRALVEVLQEYHVPSASVGIQSDTFPHTINYEWPGNVWKSNWQDWGMWGFGIDYKAPMRVASVSKPITISVWMNVGRLRARVDRPFWNMWRQNVSASVAQPIDKRVKSITVRQLLNHVSGFNNDDLNNGDLVGFDPAFMGIPVDAQINGILRHTMLTAFPGQAAYSYSNFGHMIAARLAEGVMGRPWISLVRSLFPAGAPVFAASDTVTVKANAHGPGIPGANEPSLYYVNEFEGEFNVATMAGNGNIVSNVATLSWFGTQYWMGGADDGASFTRKPPATAGLTQPHYSGMAGSMPGSIAVLAQHINVAGRASAICVITNTRPSNAGPFIDKLFDAAFAYLETVYA